MFITNFCQFVNCSLAMNYHEFLRLSMEFHGKKKAGD